MVRKSLYIAIPYLIGFLISYLLHGSDFIYLSVVISLIVLGILIFIFKLGFKQSILCETSFIVGLLIFSNYMITHVDYLKMYDNQLIDFNGKITEINNYTGDMSSYILSGSINNQDVKLSLYTNTLDCSYGDNISITASVSEISSDYLFDSKQYYNSKGIYLQVDDISNLEINSQSNFILNLIRSLKSYRNNVISTFKLNMSKESSSLLTAILFGDKSDLSKEDKNSLIRSGLGSLIAVSGFHLAILTSILDLIFKYLEKNDFPIPRIFKFLSYETFMIFFITVIDFPISAVRTFIMLSISNLATIFFRKSDTLTTLSVTSMIMLSFEPYLISNVSFLLSVVGVYGIGVLSPYLTKDLKVSNFIKGILNIAITTFCTVPVCACFFDEVSILMPISNIVCVPLCEISLICGFLTFILGGKSFFLTRGILYIADISCKLMISFCEIFSKLSFGNVPTGYDILIYIMMICVIICLVYYGIFKSVKRLAIAIIGSVFIIFTSLSAVIHIENDTLKIAMMGNSKYKVMIISYQDDVNIVDFSKNYKTSSYVQKYLKQFGYSNISSIAFFKKAYQSMVMYDINLKDYSINNVYVPQDINIRNDYEILNVTPTKTNFENNKLIYYYDNFAITVYPNGQFEILHNGLTDTFNVQKLNTILEYYKHGNFITKELK